jgi:hypothetical protein
MLNFMNIPPLGAAPIPANGQTDTLMLIGAFYDYPKASKGPAAQDDKKLLITVTAKRFFKRTYTLGLF